MSSLAEYFAQARHKPKFEFMARVEGRYKNIPFVGAISNDTVISDAIGPVYHIHLDLPMRINGKVTHYLCCKQSEIKGMKRRV